MISISNGVINGKECPICRNGSVFEERVYKWFGLFYSHTIEKCHMGKCVCDYDSRVCTRKVLIEKVYNYEVAMKRFIKKRK